MDKKKQKLNQLIKDYGLYETSKSIGISMEKLIEFSGHIINTPMDAYDILCELIENKKIETTYNGFTIYLQNFEGIFYWRNKGLWIAATPFWDGSEGIPVDIDIYDKDYYEFIYSRYQFDSVDDLKNWWGSFYLPQVLYLIQRYLNTRNLFGY